MRIIRARLQRFWHCLLTFHRPLTCSQDGRTTLVGCQCGQTWYTTPEGEHTLWFFENFIRK